MLRPHYEVDFLLVPLAYFQGHYLLLLTAEQLALNTKFKIS